MGQTPSYNRSCSKSCSITINATPQKVREHFLHFSGYNEWAKAYIAEIETTFPGEKAVYANGREISNPREDAILKITTPDREYYHVNMKEVSPNTIRWEGAPRFILDDEFNLIGKHQFDFTPIEDGNKMVFGHSLAYDETYHEGPKYGCSNEQWDFIQNEDTKNMVAFNQELKQKVEDTIAADAAFWKAVYAK